MAVTADRQRNKLLKAAKRQPSSQLDDILADLTGDLFARVAVEDLAAYSPREISQFVDTAASLLAQRTAGQPLIRLSDPEPATDGGHRNDITLIEVLNDNMPFLVDSMLGELQDFGAAVRLVAHPIVSVERDADGRLSAYYGTGEASASALKESLFQAHVVRLRDEADRLALIERLQSLLIDVRRAVANWRPMVARLRDAIAALNAEPPPINPEDIAETTAFLEWLADENFTFLGIREYRYSGGPKRGTLQRAERPGLGILGDPEVRVLRRGGQGVTMTPAIRAFLARADPLIITKSDLKSRVHRRGYTDYIGLKLYAKNGALAGEVRFIGLFTATAYTLSVHRIPYLRRKVGNVLARAGFDPNSHSGRALDNVFEHYPRDDLFQIDEDTLFEFSLAILTLGERPRVRVLARRDKFDRYVSIIVFVPRDRYDTEVRIRICDCLADAFDGHVSAFSPSFREGMLARLHVIIGRSDATSTPHPDQAALEAKVAAIVRTWSDELNTALGERFKTAEARRYRERYLGAFSVAYRHRFSVDEALADIEMFERLDEECPIAGAFYSGHSRVPEALALKLVHLGSPIPLSTRVPVLENMGFRVIDEQTLLVEPAGERPPIYVHEMHLNRADGQGADVEQAPALIDCFMAVWQGAAESDGYNALVLNAGLSWRDVSLLRALSRYLHQAGTAYSQQYMWEALNRYPAMAKALVALFHTRFDPDSADAEKAKTIAGEIDDGLETVQSLDDDRIIRRFVNVLAAVVRTNFFQRSAGGPHAEISFKLDSRVIDALPEPRPYREIFVYGPRIEGVHLRFGKVARGGIRWSDRPLDFRTEILGLAKAQQVKNAVIVPVGAKGGFVPKALPADADRTAVQAEGAAAYRTFIAALLDITDNLDVDVVVPPDGVVREDNDDPYLVVAADKGTATFSDMANGIAVDHGFWLNDAFASGGSAGYDHKKMGITARGAWESVKRHFREMDIDVQSTPFSVIGVGDMSGDVFGNAMLLSEQIKLVAAFDHRDIFVDPDPDPSVGFAERRRLFDLPRSTWQDYDRDKISPGGGVFSRQQKSVPLTPEIRALLNLSGARATPPEVVRAILKARADLLFFGGIGTFVRAAEETDSTVGDRANDAIRITAADLRVGVVGEGANLGMTQRARIAFGLSGGRCNSDSIDNSAGVNTSDVEVNIKVALGRAVREGRLDLKARNRLLAAMTDQVADVVLRNNYRQTLAISLTQRRGFADFGFQQRLMQSLEVRGLLDRAVEALPDDATLAERQGKGQMLTRAEVGVLIAYAKNVLFDDLLAGGVAEDATLDNELVRYFPQRMLRSYAEDIEVHRLRPEIIASMLTNAMIDRGGPTYLVRVGDRTGATPVEIARSFVAVRESFKLLDVYAQINALDNRVGSAAQIDLYREVQDLVLNKTVWFIRNADMSGGVGPVVEAFGKTVETVTRFLDKVLPDGFAAAAGTRRSELESHGVPIELAIWMAHLPAIADATDIHLVETATGQSLEDVARIFYQVGDALQIARVESLSHALAITDYYDGLARDRALETLAGAHRRIAIEAVAVGGLEQWRAESGDRVERAVEAVTAIAEGEELSVSRLTVAANILSDLMRQQ